MKKSTSSYDSESSLSFDFSERSNGQFQRKYPVGEGRDCRLYKIWQNMRNRCYWAADCAFHRYGGRGIGVCDEWRKNFRNFWLWSMANGYNPSLTIDRIDNDGNYEPNNCRWATPVQQQNNKHTNHIVTAWGETKSVAMWVRDPRCKVGYTCFISRIVAGHPPEIAMIKAPKPYMMTAWGETKSLQDWVNDPRCVVSITALRRRYLAWTDPIKILTTPQKPSPQSSDKRG